MRVTEAAARGKWCPFVRIDGGNRIYNMKSDGFDHEHLFYHCIGSECMAWRHFELSHMHGGAEMAPHGYCGLAGRPEIGD